MSKFIEVTEKTSGKKVSVNISQIRSVEPEYWGCRIMTSNEFFDSGIWAIESYSYVMKMIKSNTA